MAKKNWGEELTTEFKKTLEQTKMIDVEVDEELKKSFIAYAMAVNVSRAIPDARDGLKPVHRRILYSMNELGLTPDKPYKKCATIVGDVLGKYHPHGDSSVYDALVRLAQDFSINLPLVDGHGNFGSVDGDPPAAYRYTEARMSKLALEMLREIDKDTVDFYPNFDDTRMQPAVLPARYPNLLVNGSDGIAVGMATNIPPHNLNEVIDGAIALLDNPEITIDELMEYIPAPDFPTGATLLGRSGVKQAYYTGRGSILLRSKYEIEELDNGKSKIIVTEIPYQVNKQKLIESIADLVRDKKVEGISNVNDESDRQGMRIVIDIKKDYNAQVILNFLFKHTNLQVSDGMIMLALVDGEPKYLNLKQMLECYVNHQIDVITRRTKYDLNKTKEREHIVKGLVIALANIDEVIETIKSSSDKYEASSKLMQKFELSDKQANAILDMRLQRLTSLEVEKLREELVQLDLTIADLTDILEKPERIKGIIKNDLTDMKNRYPTPRKTELSYNYGDIDAIDLIEKEDVVISMTHLGYVKRLPVKEYKSQRRGGKGIIAHKAKEEDFIENMFICSSHDKLLFFTTKGKVYQLMCYEIPEAQRTAKGRAIINLLPIETGEKVTAVIPCKDDSSGFIAMATKNGLIKKTALSEFDNIRKTGKIAISLVDTDELISVEYTDGNCEFIVASHKGKCIRFSENDVRPMGRDTQGVKSMDIDSDDYIVNMEVVKDGYDIFTISTNGYGKRSDISDYRLQNRAGKGIKAGVFNAKTGNIACFKFVLPEDDILMITEDGTIIRVQACEISKLGRDTQGVIIMRTDKGAVSTVAITPHEEESEEDFDLENETAEGETDNSVETETTDVQTQGEIQE